MREVLLVAVACGLGCGNPQGPKMLEPGLVDMYACTPMNGTCDYGQQCCTGSCENPGAAASFCCVSRAGDSCGDTAFCCGPGLGAGAMRCVTQTGGARVCCSLRYDDCPADGGSKGLKRAVYNCGAGDFYPDPSVC